MIKPFDADQNPLAGVVEDHPALYAFGRSRNLVPLADVVWSITPREERRRMLRHLYAHILQWEDSLQFGVLGEMLEDYSEERLVALADEEDFDGKVPIILHLYLALYVDTSKGVSAAYFSTDAFYRQYLEAHGRQ